MHIVNTALASMRRFGTHGLRSLWAYLRRVSGDDAYERYVAHLRACHPDATPLSPREHFRRRHEEKWSRPSRCC